MRCTNTESITDESGKTIGTRKTWQAEGHTFTTIRKKGEGATIALIDEAVVGQAKGPNHDAAAELAAEELRRRKASPSSSRLPAPAQVTPAAPKAAPKGPPAKA